MAAPASATMGISTAIVLEIEAGSMSTWIMDACLANSPFFPVMRSLKRVPMEKRTSQLLTAELAAKLP